MFILSLGMPVYVSSQAKALGPQGEGRASVPCVHNDCANEVDFFVSGHWDFCEKNYISLNFVKLLRICIILVSISRTIYSEDFLTFVGCWPLPLPRTCPHEEVRRRQEGTHTVDFPGSKQPCPLQTC